jgi:high affinity Mn2+ porin
VWVAGHAWGRARDVVGAATIRNSISNERARFLNAGGLGILVGDGRLPHAGAERILEVYYRLAVASDSHVTLDYQRVTNPAYNRDRGPVSILALRVHTEF